MPFNLHRFNFILLLSHGTLCVFQWNTERTARSRIGSLLKERETLTQRVTEQTDSLQAANADLDGFRKQILALKSQTDEQVATIRTQKAQVARLEATEAAHLRQLEQWKQALEEYRVAIEARDGQIKTLVEQRDKYYEANKVAIERANRAVATLNDLNEKYSDVVTRYNALAAQNQAQEQAKDGAAAKQEAENSEAQGGHGH
jgi:chromosome segregation ATPase